MHIIILSTFNSDKHINNILMWWIQIRYIPLSVYYHKILNLLSLDVDIFYLGNVIKIDINGKYNLLIHSIMSEKFEIKILFSGNKIINAHGPCTTGTNFMLWHIITLV